MKTSHYATKKKQVVRTYPWVGYGTYGDEHDKDFVVFFVKCGCGYVLSSNYTMHRVGTYIDHWDESRFTDFHGTITFGEGRSEVYS